MIPLVCLLVGWSVLISRAGSNISMLLSEPLLKSLPLLKSYNLKYHKQYHKVFIFAKITNIVFFICPMSVKGRRKIGSFRLFIFQPRGWGSMVLSKLFVKLSLFVFSFIQMSSKHVVKAKKNFEIYLISWISPV